MLCNLLTANEYQKEHIIEKSKRFPDKVYRSQSVEESDSDIEIVIVYLKVVYSKEVQHLNREGEGSDSSNNISEPLNTTDQAESENDTHHEFIPRRSAQVRAKQKIFTYDQLGKNLSLISS